MRESTPQQYTDPDTFNVRRSWVRAWSAIFRHKLLIVVTTLLTIGLVVAYIFIWPPVYKANVAFTVERDNDIPRNNFYRDWSMFRKDDIESETNMMGATFLVEKVARDLDLTYDEVYHSFLSWTQHLWRSSWPGNKYREAKEYFFPPKVTPWDPTPEQMELGKIVVDFQKGVSTSRLGQSYVGILTVRASTGRAVEMANAMMDAYLEYRLARHQEEADRAYDTLSAQEQSVRAQLESKEADLVVFAKKHGLLFDFEREKVEVKQWLDLRASITGIRAGVAGSRAKLKTVESFLGEEPPEITGSRSFQKNQLKQELEIARIHQWTDRVDKLNRYNQDAPEIQLVERNIDAFDALIRETEHMVASGHTDVLNSSFESLRMSRNETLAELDGSEASLKVMQQAESDLGKRLDRIPGLRQEYTQLGREISILQQKFGEVLTRLAQAEVSRATLASSLPSLRVIEYARPSAQPAWPRTKLLLLIAGCVGLLLGTGAAVLRDLYLNQVRLEDVAAGRGDAPFYAWIEVGAHGRRFDLARSNGSPRAHSNGATVAGHTNGNSG